MKNQYLKEFLAEVNERQQAAYQIDGARRILNHTAIAGFTRFSAKWICESDSLELPASERMLRIIDISSVAENSLDYLLCKDFKS